MKYIYLTKFIEFYANLEYFDPRENMGCSFDEVYEIDKSFKKFGMGLPLVLEEELLFCGKFRCNVLGTYHRIYNSIKNKFYKPENKLSNGFFVIDEGDFGIFLNKESYFLEFVKINDLKNIGSDDPPYFHKIGDIEDDDIEISICLNNYSQKFDTQNDNFSEQYSTFYRKNQAQYFFKQKVVDLYSLIEHQIEFENERINIIFNALAQRLRQECYNIMFRNINLIFDEVCYQVESSFKTISSQNYQLSNSDNDKARKLNLECLQLISFLKKEFLL
jgi:hypothetical protein